MLKIFFIILGLAYLLSPYDILPDFMGLPGRLDDVLFIGFLIWKYHQITKRSKPTEAGTESEKTDPHDNQKVEDPYSILNLEPTASQDQIDAAYRELMKQYHPDRVNHLGPELKALAHEKTVKIQAAYEQLKSKA